MSKKKLEILKLLREINELEKANSFLSITELYNKNNNDIIKKNNLLILEKKELLEELNKKEQIKVEIQIEPDNKIDILPDKEIIIKKEEDSKNKVSLQELNIMNKKELLKAKEEKRLAKELLLSRH
jgi:hypothetical protein